VFWLLAPPAPLSFSLELPTTGRIRDGTVRYIPFVDIEVSPLGYPIAGEFWTINVYVVNKTFPDKLTYYPASNATLIVTLLSEGTKKTYELSTNEYGEATFQYHFGYMDIAFEAQIPELSPSQKVVLSTHYISPDFVDGLLTFNFISIVAWLPSGYIISDKIGLSAKWVKLEKGTLLLIFFLFAFVSLFALYSKFSQETIWGYPYNVVNGLITLSLLRDIFYLWVILLVSYSAIKFIVWVIQKKSTKSTPTK